MSSLSVAKILKCHHNCTILHSKRVLAHSSDIDINEILFGVGGEMGMVQGCDVNDGVDTSHEYMKGLVISNIYEMLCSFSR